MKISNLKVGASKVTVQAKVVNKEDPREVVRPSKGKDAALQT